MPKSADPNRYLDNFKYQVKNAKDRYQRLEQSLDSSHESNDTKKGVAEDSAFRLGVLWETFQGDWFVAAISRNPSAFVGEMQGQLHKAVSDKWARDVIEMKSPGAVSYTHLDVYKRQSRTPRARASPRNGRASCSR